MRNEERRQRRIEKVNAEYRGRQHGPTPKQLEEALDYVDDSESSMEETEEEKRARTLSPLRVRK